MGVTRGLSWLQYTPVFIQRVHIKFTDGKNLEGNEPIAKEKNIVDKRRK